MKTTLNRLAKANSPYLQQHANNPVDWYEWGEDALSKARNENKPLIISIGYAACHWCHVMAHESFMDQEVAEFMNSHFVCIKVDREERPDIDQIYMEAAQYITGSGGWPLHAFTLPNGKPFHAGTYFTRIQWLELLKRIVPVYDSQFPEIEKQADSITIALQPELPAGIVNSARSDPGIEQYKALIRDWEGLIDHQEGGFTTVPKFPLPVAWELLLQYFHLTGSDQALQWVNLTLQAISGGGIYDQAGGGFSRYSTDRYWKVPHFEKMLYDNAQLISLISHAYQVTRQARYAEIIEQSIGFIQREMMNGEGACYSSLDADSEGEEGKFYTFTQQQIREILDPSVFQIVAGFYQITADGNWEKGRNILFPQTTVDAFAVSQHLDPLAIRKILSQANEKIMNLRNQRIRPTRDEKIITSWNALMIKAFLDAYHALGHPAYLDASLNLARFLEKKMFDTSGILHRSYKDGNASIVGFLDDYSYFAEALIGLYESTFNLHWLELSKELTLFAMDHFSDRNSPLFFYSSDLSEPLIARKHEVSDHVMPSSNSVMVNVLNRLGLMYDDPVYIRRANEILDHVLSLKTSPGPYFANYIRALGWKAFIPNEIALVGVQAAEKNSILQRNFLPTSVIVGGSTENLPLLQKRLVKDATLIYVCRNKSCQLPVEEVETALKLLK
jgi:uncharacterized protein